MVVCQDFELYTPWDSYFGLSWIDQALAMVRLQQQELLLLLLLQFHLAHLGVH